ncbi:hypothetical protein EYM_06425 [Ignicoccus islandicus DSM 13165]|uniref:Chorismate mutase n=1 Tax=Ignicoccus islandicus DSM 13165 TaxID=940295 RepID=A0A0U3G3C3_9CREN|nr:prephenate dehydrogenase/arogenate dehydrogenase family protein [Ignicoccus islandicus]ALU12684.1 hypothetical protein EYM_06425 [Ignicoccus islandicus DSM 13165]
MRPTNPYEYLKVKRRELDKIDREILELLKKRIETVSEITNIKKSLNLPVVDEEREEEVLKSRSIWAAEMGLDWRYVEDIYNVILTMSRSVQLYANEKLYVGIYGYGGMARTLAALFSRAGHNVVITGRNMDKAKELAERLKVDVKEPEEVAREVEWLILTTPPEATLEVARSLTKYMRSGSLLSDILSIKLGIVDKILEELPEYIEYVSLHPLFGPDVNPVGETIVIIPLKSYDYWIGKLNSVLTAMGLRVVISTLEEHEKAMAITQVPHHFALMTLQETMERLSRELGVNYKDYVTHSLKKTMEVVERLSELRGVIEEIQRNKYSKLSRKTFIEVAKELDEKFNQPS